MNEHTPGPWDSCSYAIRQAARMIEATIRGEAWKERVEGKFEANALATAHLITAAPDLLVACELALLGLREWERLQREVHPESVDGWLTIEKCEQAIAKATGGER